MKTLKEWLSELPKGAKTYTEMCPFTAWDFDHNFEIAYKKEYVFYQGDIAYCYRICWKHPITKTTSYLWITKNTGENYPQTHQQ
ncbi:hypothetical protein [Mucilaginibacter sp. 10I4]|uniref:hypothetical protein n=1 Tax=Mucilaginibacter sp. 10I4 TaxID=3048580 RepID=UPI002B225331|nr:hypothetical protein [Mucilaginibacter sp. 10I4]MEB0262890.1 hypothetical protein [Mucilaginibacter sp. 10I4]